LHVHKQQLAESKRQHRHAFTDLVAFLSQDTLHVQSAQQQELRLCVQSLEQQVEAARKTCELLQLKCQPSLSRALPVHQRQDPPTIPLNTTLYGQLNDSRVTLAHQIGQIFQVRMDPTHSICGLEFYPSLHPWRNMDIHVLNAAVEHAGRLLLILCSYYAFHLPYALSLRGIASTITALSSEQDYPLFYTRHNAKEYCIGLASLCHAAVLLLHHISTFHPTNQTQEITDGIDLIGNLYKACHLSTTQWSIDCMELDYFIECVRQSATDIRIDKQPEEEGEEEEWNFVEKQLPPTPMEMRDDAY
jgi:hypothetical protein